MNKIVVDEKYTILEDMDNGILECLRYEEPWRNLIGDGLVYALVLEIKKAREQIFTCPDCGYKISYQEFISQSEEDE